MTRLDATRALVGLWYSVRGSPHWAIRPSNMTAMRSAMDNASS